VFEDRGPQGYEPHTKRETDHQAHTEGSVVVETLRTEVREKRISNKGPALFPAVSLYSPPPQKKSRSMYYGEHGVERREREEREREREEAPLALRATRPHTVGYTGVCDQEQGLIECTEGSVVVETLRTEVREKRISNKGPALSGQFLS